VQGQKKTVIKILSFNSLIDEMSEPNRNKRPTLIS